MDKKIIISRIDELMQEKGINKYQLKENAEVSSTIYQWRKNAARDKDRTPSLRSIEKICDFLGVTLAYFFSFSKSKYRICIISLIIISIFFLLTLLSTTAFGFIAFTNNIGYQSEKTTDINDIIFYISLSFCFVFLILLVFFIVKLKSRQK